VDWLLGRVARERAYWAALEAVAEDLTLPHLSTERTAPADAEQPDSQASGFSLDGYVGLLAAAAAQEAVLSCPDTFAALFRAPAVPADVATSPQPAADTACLLQLEPKTAVRLASQLLPGFLRAGYHPPSPFAFSAALSQEEKRRLLLEVGATRCVVLAARS
jgi:hypothetical protein